MCNVYGEFSSIIRWTPSLTRGRAGTDNAPEVKSALIFTLTAMWSLSLRLCILKHCCTADFIRSHLRLFIDKYSLKASKASSYSFFIVWIPSVYWENSTHAHWSGPRCESARVLGRQADTREQVSMGNIHVSHYHILDSLSTAWCRIEIYKNQECIENAFLWGGSTPRSGVTNFSEN